MGHDNQDTYVKQSSNWIHGKLYKQMKINRICGAVFK